MKLRQIALDTETTGLEVQKGHRIIEIGCVEIIDRRLTGNNFHVYINPDRAIDEQAQKVHGLSQAFLSDKPYFFDIFTDFFEYIDGAQLIIHNAAFDLGFLNAEFKRLAKKLKPIEQYCSVLDTLLLARRLHPGQKNNLDALCKRYHIENKHRVFHGALLDADILAKLYLSMSSGQHSLFLEEKEMGEYTYGFGHLNQKIHIEDIFPVIRANDNELNAHSDRLQYLSKISGKASLWSQFDGKKDS
jgi:DNA polymerase III subunit epsilon